MSSTEHIASEAAKCIISRCGVCLSACPVYSVKNLTLYSMRGRLITAYSALRGIIGRTPLLHESLFSCSLCGLCELVCPPGVRTLEFVEALRRDIASAMGYHPAHENLLANLAAKGHPYSDDVVLGSSIVGDCGVAYFPGCTAQLKLPGVAERAVEHLREALGGDLAVVYGCCGGIAKRIGATELFNSAKKKLEELVASSRIEELVVTCAGCYSTLSKHYKLGKVKVKHISSFLCEASKGRRKLLRQAKAVYHDPCHLGRHSNLYDEPRILLAEHAGLELLEFKENREKASCCGGGGGLTSAFRGLAQQIAFNRLRELQLLGVNRLVTSCPFCELNFKEAAKRYGLRVEVLDVVEALT
ncbi:MAG: (Fe-S)-binding protein [Candidatus Nezhaarchaeota archaeon]|nr:(Fe-S)-binding protein [Candidatus Nezhaarchaeota archaeon]